MWNFAKIGFCMQAEKWKIQFFAEKSWLFMDIFVMKKFEKLKENNGKLAGIVHGNIECQFWKKKFAHAAGNHANESFHCKANPNHNSSVRFGSGAAKRLEMWKKKSEK